MVVALAVTASLHHAKAASAVVIAVVSVGAVVISAAAIVVALLTELLKATVSVIALTIVFRDALLTTLAPQTATFAKVVSTTATAAVASLHAVIQLLVAISHRVVTLLRVKSLLHVATSHLAASAMISLRVATSPHVKISPLAVTSLHVATLLTVNQHSQSLALPSQRLLSQLQSLVTAVKYLCHVIWRRRVQLKLSNL